MKKNVTLTIFVLVTIILAFSGCFDLFSQDSKTTTYQKHPTKLSFTISYGYNINCTGTGQYNIEYNCDIPEVLNGQDPVITYPLSSDESYEEKTFATFNKMKCWDITSSENIDYNLGITVNVQTESYVVADLEGTNALTIQEIYYNYPELVNQYCQKQSNDTTVFIDPTNQKILTKANEILDSVETSNSFLVAKELFIWLKEETTYERHTGNNDVQTSVYTLNSKSGDCDDLSFLYIALCRAIGIPARFIRGFLVEKNTATPHAWLEIFVGGGIGNQGWIPIECAGTADTVEKEIHQNFGLEGADHLRLFKDDGSNESLTISLSGLSYKLYSPSRDVSAKSYVQVTSYNVIESKELDISDSNIRSYQ